jgi:hypothetical protein
VPTGRDLDNYLYPLARTFGAHRIAAAFGRKAHQPRSTIAVGPAVPVSGPLEPPQLSIRTSMSATTTAWKQAVHEACEAAVAGPTAAGPVALRIRLGVSSSRNWTALWKPAIDSLGPVLGISNPELPFRPDDDRIVELELHRSIDDALGHDVVVEAWWHSAAGR